MRKRGRAWLRETEKCQALSDSSEEGEDSPPDSGRFLDKINNAANESGLFPKKYKAKNFTAKLRTNFGMNDSFTTSKLGSFHSVRGREP